MGGISTSTDFDPSTADMVLSEDYDLVGDDVSAILEMNRKAEIADAESERELDIGIEGFESGSEEDDDMLDFSNPTKGEGSDLLEANFLDKIKNLDKDALKGLGGKGSGPQSLGSSGSLKGASAEGVTGARGFRGMESPYASPKYYSPRGSVEFQKMVSGLLSDVFKTSIRKPTIRSLI